MTDTTLFNLTGKKALVTGGAVGIGRACATALAMSGADVAIIDINEKVGEKTAESIRRMGRDSFFILCDVSDEQQVETMVTLVIERFGRLDIGVNNAGVNAQQGHERQTKSEWDRVLGVNLMGVLYCTQVQAKQMIKQHPPGGKIINTASIAANIVGTNAAYSVSKAGVVHMTRQLAAQFGGFNININCFSPGVTMTSMFSSSSLLEFREKIREMIPMGYIQRPEDIYGTIIFLASDASNFVTGQNIIVDGGYTLGHWVESLKRAVPPRVTPEEEIRVME